MKKIKKTATKKVTKATKATKATIKNKKNIVTKKVTPKKTISTSLPVKFYNKLLKIAKRENISLSKLICNTVQNNIKI